MTFQGWLKMELVVNFQDQYFKFVKENKGGGLCMGLCLVWLGDILKNRPVEGQGFMSKWTPVWLSSSSPIARIPRDKTELDKLFHRAKKRQDNYVLKSNGRANHLSRTERMVNYKNQRQAQLEDESGNPGLQYTYREFDNIFTTQGVEFTGRLQGTIISMCFPKKNIGHAVAVISLSPDETYFLDPNVGLYKVDNKNITMEIAEFIIGNYEDVQIAQQIIISRK